MEISPSLIQVKMKKRFDRKKGSEAISQIAILLLGTIAFAYAIGQIGVVSAAGLNSPCTKDSDCGASYLRCSSKNCIINPACVWSSSPTTQEDCINWYAANGPGRGQGIITCPEICPPDGYGSTPNVNGIPITPSSSNTNSNPSTSSQTGSPSTAAGTKQIGEYCSLPSQSDSECASGYCDYTSSCANLPSQPAPAPSANPPPVSQNPTPQVGNDIISQCKQSCITAPEVISCIQGCGLQLANDFNSVNSVIKSLTPGAATPAAAGPTALQVLQHEGLAPENYGASTFFGNVPGQGGQFWTNLWNSIKGPLQTGAQIAGAAATAYGFYQLVKWAVTYIPGYDPNSQGAAWIGFASTVVSGSLVFPALLGFFNSNSLVLGIGFGPWALIGSGVALIFFFATYQQHTVKAVQFTCIPWQAPLGGSDCTKCGENGLPCSVYQCQSLGLNCQLLNVGVAGKQLCVASNQTNLAPIMSFWKDNLPPNYSVTPLRVSVLSTNGDTGVTITSDQADGNVPPYTNLVLGITTDKASVCGWNTTRIDIKDSTGADTFNQLILMDNGLYEFNHTLLVPSGIQPQNGIEQIFVRCHDSNSPPDYTPNYFIIQFGVRACPGSFCTDYTCNRFAKQHACPLRNEFSKSFIIHQQACICMQMESYKSDLCKHANNEFGGLFNGKTPYFIWTADEQIQMYCESYRNIQ